MRQADQKEGRKGKEKGKGKGREREESEREGESESEREREREREGKERKKGRKGKEEGKEGREEGRKERGGREGGTPCITEFYVLSSQSHFVQTLPTTSSLQAFYPTKFPLNAPSSKKSSLTLPCR